MRYAIVINLDYDSNEHDECRRVWSLIREQMLAAGFRMEGRLFTAALPGSQACDLARNVIDGLDAAPLVHGKGVYTFLKEFYGYDHTQTINLLVPPTDSITIEER